MDNFNLQDYIASGKLHANSKTLTEAKKQGYDDREDESLGARKGAEKDKKQSMKDRRDDSYGKFGKRDAEKKGKNKINKEGVVKENEEEELELDADYDKGGKYYSEDGAEAFNIQPFKMNDVKYTKHEANRMGKYIVGLEGEELKKFISDYMGAFEAGKGDTATGKTFKEDLEEDARTDAEEEGYLDGEKDEKWDGEDKLEDEEIDLEDMSEDDIKGFIEDVIKDLVADGTIEAGDEAIEDEEDIEDVVDVDDIEDVEDVDLDAEIDEAKVEDLDEMSKKEKAEGDDRKKDDKIEAETEKMRFKEALDEINALKVELNEVNLLNAKLLYTNKVFKSKNLSEDKKVKVLKAFDKASTVKEAKVIFETLNEGLVSKTEAIARPKGAASKATGTITEAKKPIIESNDVYNRMRKLAGLI